MLFNSHVFLFAFLPAVLVVYYLLGARGLSRMCVGWLATTSLLFYGWWNPVYLALILYSVGFNFGLSALMQRAQNRGSPTKALLVAGVLKNLLLLAYFKYTMFILKSIAWASKADFAIPEIVLPLAISFFTFQQIAYLVDTHKGLTEEKNFLNYLLFVTFFPQLIAGPIVHHKEMLSQYYEEKIYRFDPARICIGGTLFAIGLFKKVMLADNAAAFANPVFDDAANGIVPSFSEAWLAALSYTFQLYFDFSGYSEMAIGVGAMFGLRLPLNFNSPYKATSISDFWQRWHITLSRFLRDYLYIPLGGNRRGTSRRYINLMLTMLLGGLWHGAGWTFVVWGALHGGYLIVQYAWRTIRREPENKSCLGQFLAWSLTFLAVVVGWVFFRAADCPAAIHILGAMIGLGGETGTNLHQVAGYSWLILLAVVAFCMPNCHQFMGRFSPALEQHVKSRFSSRRRLGWQPGFAWGAVMGILFLLAVLWIAPDNEFIYFQF